MAKTEARRVSILFGALALILVTLGVAFFAGRQAQSKTEWELSERLVSQTGFRVCLVKFKVKKDIGGCKEGSEVLFTPVYGKEGLDTVKATGSPSITETETTEGRWKKNDDGTYKLVDAMGMLGDYVKLAMVDGKPKMTTIYQGQVSSTYTKGEN